MSLQAARLQAELHLIQESLTVTDAFVLAGGSPSGICAALPNLQSHTANGRITVFGVDGTLLCSSIVGVTSQPDVIAGRPYFKAVLTTGKDQIGGPLMGTFSGRLSLTFAHLVSLDTRFPVVAVLAVDVVDVIEPLDLSAHQVVTVLIGQAGEQAAIGTPDLFTLPAALRSSLQRSADTGTACPVVVAEGSAWACSPVGDTGLLLVAGAPERQVFALVSDIAARRAYWVTGMVLVGIMTVLLMDFLFLRRLLRAYGATGLTALSASSMVREDEIDVLSEWASQTSVVTTALETRVSTYQAIQETADRDLLTLIAETVEIRYPFLRNHGDRVGLYSRRIGIRLGIDGEELEMLAFAARVHDLGKIAIPDAIYLKPGSLTLIELAQMQLHAPRGGEMSQRMHTIDPAISLAIRHHHESWDGTGYPDGLSRMEIPLWSRVIAVGDAYDAMTESRPYRVVPLTHEVAIGILQDGAGKQWDTTIVDAFLELVKLGGVTPVAGSPPGGNPPPESGSVPA